MAWRFLRNTIVVFFMTVIGIVVAEVATEPFSDGAAEAKLQEFLAAPLSLAAEPFRGWGHSDVQRALENRPGLSVFSADEAQALGLLTAEPLAIVIENAARLSGPDVRIGYRIPETQLVLGFQVIEAFPFDLWSVLLGIGIIGMCAASTSLLMSWPLLRRAQGLASSAQEIGEGNFSARADESGVDEFAVVARQFNGMARRLEAQLVHQRGLLHALAHEYRTPLARARFGLEMLLDAEAPPDRERFAGKLEASLDALDELVDEVLEYVRIDLADPLEGAVAGDAARWLQEALDDVAVADDVEVEVSTGAEEQMLWSDRRHYVRVVRNLVGNAVRHAESKVALTLYREGDRTVLEVADDGPGIPVAQRELVFEAFYRGDLSRARERRSDTIEGGGVFEGGGVNDGDAALEDGDGLGASGGQKGAQGAVADRSSGSGGGSGLGLAIASRLARAYGATLHIDDAGLGGALFVLRWPREALGTRRGKA